MKFCVSRGVGTWTNWSTFEPDQDDSPDARTGKSESRTYVKVGQTGTGRTAERYCLLHVVVLGPVSFAGLSTFLYDVGLRLRSYGASKLPNFGFWPIFPIQNS